MTTIRRSRPRRAVPGERARRLLSYVVISPVRNEASLLPLTIASMCAQTARPKRWVLVDDGSTDGTAALIDEAAARNSWITAVHRRDRGSRQAGGGVVEAFYEGYRCVTSDAWELVVKLDGDLSFGADYFERCLGEFEVDEKLGIGGGTCCIQDAAVLREEFLGEPAFHVRGPTKIYRKTCFDAIGGLWQAPGWDTIDQVKANMLGWHTRTFAGIKLIHHRQTGGAYGSWANWKKNGLANYITGYGPFFMALKCLKRTVTHFGWSGLVEGGGLWVGYMSGYVKRVRRVQDAAMIRYLRSQQWRALTGRHSLWSGPRPVSESPNTEK